MRKVSHIYAEMVQLDDGCVMDFSLSKNLYVYYYYTIKYLLALVFVILGMLAPDFALKSTFHPRKLRRSGPLLPSRIKHCCTV